MPSNRQTIPRAEREDEILASARAEFAAGGFDDTTVAAVARRAGMTSANVHYYFPSKDDLFAEVVARTYRDLLGDLDRLDDPAQRLRRYVTFHLRRFPLRGAVQSVAARNEALRRCLEGRDEWLRSTARELVADPVDRDVLAAVVIGLVEDSSPRRNPNAVLDAAIARLGG